MVGKILTEEEFLKDTGLVHAEFREWEKLGLLKPFGRSSGGEALFDARAVETAKFIFKLTEMGYGLDEIHRIVRKVGFPGSTGKARQVRDKKKFLTVGELSEKTGLSARTIKHWEEKDLLTPDAWSEGGFRLYNLDSVRICVLIKDLQRFGYTLHEILFFKPLLNGADNSLPTKQAILEAANLKDAIVALEKDLDKIKSGLKRWESRLKQCRKELDRTQAKLKKSSRKVDE